MDGMCKFSLAKMPQNPHRESKFRFSDNAPATKAGITTLAITSLIGWFLIDGEAGIAPNTFSKLQFWRLFTSQWACSNPIDLLVCIGALYSSRHFERMLGTAKTCALGTAVTSASALGSLLLATLGSTDTAWLRPIQGPYALLGAALFLFTKLIPQRVHTQFTILGVRFSDKSFSYLMFAHVICAHGARSMLPALLGVLLAAAYLYNAGGFGRVRLPAVISDLAAKTILPIFTAEHPVARAARKAEERAARERRQMEAAVRETMRRQGGRRRAAGGGGTEEEQVQAALAQLLAQNNGDGAQQATPGTGGSGAAPAGGGADAFVPPLPEADEEAVQRLVGMGFGEEAARQALAATYNDENAAVNRLVGGT